MQKPSPTPVCGKTVFHKTSPWCQKGCGLLHWRHSALTVANKEEGDNLSFLAKGLGEKPLMSGSKQEGGGAVGATSPRIPKHPPMCHLGFKCPGVFPSEYEPQILVGTILQSR